MTKLDALVISASTYSWWAAYLSSGRETRSRWFRVAPDQSGRGQQGFRTDGSAGRDPIRDRPGLTLR